MNIRDGPSGQFPRNGNTDEHFGCRSPRHRAHPHATASTSMGGCHSHGFRAVSQPLSLPWHTEFPFLIPDLFGDITAYTRFTHLRRENAVCAVLTVASPFPCAFHLPSVNMPFPLQRYLTPSGPHRYSCGTRRKSSFQGLP